MKNNVSENSPSQLIPLRPLIGYSLLAIISGLSGFAFITIINKIISNSITATETLSMQNYLYLFAGTIVVFFISRRWLAGGIIKLSQKIYWDIRKDVIKLILKAPYRKLQEYKEEVYATLTTDVNNISNASLMIITFFSSLILIVACLIYMAFLSLKLLGVSAIVIAMGVLIYALRSKNSNKQLKEVREMEKTFIGIFNSILNGAKEININPAKGTQIYDQKLMKVATTGETKYVNALLKYLNSEIISQVLFYGLISFILVFSGSVFQTPTAIKVSFTFVLLYLMGPIVSVMTIIPVINKAVVSLKKMQKLKEDLTKLEQLPQVEHKGQYRNFSDLKIRNYAFSYGEDQFSVGPINFDINRNEVVFVYGGNGEGKTTFINTVLNLYNLDNGEAYIDGELVPLKELDKIKNLFAPVFSDFYLFDAFYGITDVDYDKVNKYLKLFELEGKVSVKDGYFSTTHLSTGQRKRMALISTLLEDRPIIVLDEWAADQDPHFRHKFYTEILQVLVQEEDKTIIAITHDDRYYNRADTLLKMEYGKLEKTNISELSAIF
ncbi:cyclic peptide export ABC transporter [Flavobacterium collinsii]|jgi:putative ATP-binding cassette transporter|uniref:ABC transporter ATP-binding/permease protein YojI n=1 Tax=Flavobacterium collinsii TaxID=1114861 RepID=A0A9W4X6E3_9FLAO|nr:cyclic peptide export ABC transporter [Flavobacterium collinsii]GIQ60995.1 pyoverdine biosynthesis protein PvdE [Flavobacterium collinsii]CAI2767086.1 ABC transporter ATP-binding/permease protein YojI [Flavobacterium collinsii]